MSEAESTPLVPAPTENSFQRIAGIIFNPAPTLRSIAERPTWLVPLLLAMIVGITSAAIIVQRMDLESALREGYEKAGMEPAQIEEMLPTMLKIQGIIATTSWIFIPPIIFAIQGGIFLLAFKLLGGEGTFKKTFAISAYTWIPNALKQIIFAVVAFPHRELSQEAVQTLLKSNLSFLVRMQEHPVLFALLGALDVFSIWWLVLLILGLEFVSKLSRAKVAVIALLLYGFWTLIAVVGAVLSAGGFS